MKGKEAIGEALMVEVIFDFGVEECEGVCQAERWKMV